MNSEATASQTATAGAFDPGSKCKTPGCCTCDLPRCPECGYTKHDAAHWLDHHLCGGTIPPEAPPQPAPERDATARAEDDAALKAQTARSVEEDVAAHREKYGVSTPQSPASDDGWRTMDSAPKDGTEVDIWGSVFPDCKPRRIAGCHFAKGCWVTWESEDISSGPNWLVVADPKFWRPLPQPPVSPQRKEEQHVCSICGQVNAVCDRCAGSGEPDQALATSKSAGAERPEITPADFRRLVSHGPAKSAGAATGAGDESLEREARAIFRVMWGHGFDGVAVYERDEDLWLDAAREVRKACAASRVRADSVAAAVAAEREALNLCLSVMGQMSAADYRIWHRHNRTPGSETMTDAELEAWFQKAISDGWAAIAIRARSAAQKEGDAS